MHAKVILVLISYTSISKITKLRIKKRLSSIVDYSITPYILLSITMPIKINIFKNFNKPAVIYAVPEREGGRLQPDGRVRLLPRGEGGTALAMTDERL